MDGPYRSMADSFFYRFRVCLFCKRLLCHKDDCETPKCRSHCKRYTHHYNTNFKFVCAACYDRYLREFERQFRPQLRLEAPDGET